jgi:hypothetical protein
VLFLLLLKALRHSRWLPPLPLLRLLHGWLPAATATAAAVAVAAVQQGWCHSFHEGLFGLPACHLCAAAFEGLNLVQTRRWRELWRTRPQLTAGRPPWPKLTLHWQRLLLLV